MRHAECRIEDLVVIAKMIVSTRLQSIAAELCKTHAYGIQLLFQQRLFSISPIELCEISVAPANFRKGSQRVAKLTSPRFC